MNELHKPRPYWHVDLKWVCGLLALLGLGASLLLFNLSALTERATAIKLSGTIVASLFSRDGLDDEKGLAEFRQKAAAAPGDVVTPMEQYPQLQISKHEALTLSARELRIAIFSQLTTPIYDKGLKGAAAEMTPDLAAQEKFVRDAALLGVFTKKAHATVQRAFYIVAVVTVILLAGAIYFSAGIGRLVTPGILLLAASVLGSLTGLMLRYPPKDGDAPQTALPPNITEAIGNSLIQSFGTLSVLGGAMLLGAVILKIIAQVKKKA